MMDPLTADVAANLIASAIGSTVRTSFAYLARRIAKNSRGNDVNEGWLQSQFEEASVGQLIQMGVSAAARQLPEGGTAIDRLKILLVSPDVEAVVRQLFATTLGSDKDRSRLSTLRETFRLILLSQGPEDVELERISGELFDAIVDACQRMLEHAVAQGNIKASDAVAAARHNIVRDELALIGKRLASLEANDRPKIANILDFERRYRREVGHRHSMIIPPHLTSAREVPIDDLYVMSKLITVPRRKKDEPRPLSPDVFLAEMYRAVVLGNPGGGKSTLAQKICHDLAAQYDNRPFGGRQLTPVLVVLREYAAANQAHRCSILEFITSEATARYQQRAVPRDAFEYLLLSGRIMLIFDGLDELMETQQRRKVSDDVESFCREFSAVPVLVTSREVGYEQAPLDPRSFDVFRLAPFNDDQVNEYARKWFCLDYHNSPEANERKAAAFLDESRAVPDLRSNPLMLGLMCNIYREEHYIPRNRPEVYRKCAELLFDRWDRRRDIPVRFRFESEFRPAMAFLAHWIYANEPLQGGVSEQQLIGKTAEYLLRTRFEDRDEAEATARDFVEFCHGRAWVFTDMGSTADEGLYQFTHRTFLEYFTALYLIRTHETVDELVTCLVDKIDRREWDVVAQLAAQIRASESENAADRILAALLENLDELSKPARANRLLFATRCLQFLVPTPAMVRRISSLVLQAVLSLDTSHQQPVQSENGWVRSRRLELLWHLLQAEAGNRRAVAAALLEEAAVALKEETAASVRAAELGVSLPLGLHIIHLREVAPISIELEDFWHKVATQFLAKNEKRLRVIAAGHSQVAVEMWRRERITLKELVEHHGVEALFIRRALAVFEAHFLDVAAALLGSVVIADAENTPDRTWLRLLSEVGEVLPMRPAPWIGIRSRGQPYHPWWFWDSHRYPSHASREVPPFPVSGIEALGAFVLAATLFELRVRDRRQSEHALIGGDAIPVFTLVRARFESVTPEAFKQAWKSVELPPEHQALVVGWISGRVNFVRGTKQSKGVIGPPCQVLVNGTWRSD